MTYLPGVRVNRTVAIAASDCTKASDIAGLATMFNSTLVNAYSALVFNDPGMTAAKGAFIIENANLTVTNAYNITISANLSSDKEQAVLYQVATDNVIAKLLDIITSSRSDVTISGNTTLTDTNVYKNLTINTGITLTLQTTLSGISAVLIADTITNNGTIIRLPQGGAQGITGIMYRISTDSAGVSGSGGNYGGGAGGGVPSYTTKTSAEIKTYLLNAVIDYLIATIQSKSAPTSPQNFINVYGSGGYHANTTNGPGGAGGGGLLIICKTLVNSSLIINTGHDGYDGNTGGSVSAAGGGGGTGGESIIVTNSYDNTGGTISCIGGNGGAGIQSGGPYGGGGGGGGGILYILYRSQTNAGTLSVGGGTGGTGGSVPAAGGGNGTAMAIAL